MSLNLRILLADRGSKAGPHLLAALRAEFHYIQVTDAADALLPQLCELFRPDCLLITDATSGSALRETETARSFPVVLIESGAAAPATDLLDRHSIDDWLPGAADSGNAVYLHLLHSVLERAVLKRRQKELEAELEECRFQLQLAEEAGCLGTWVWSQRSKKLKCSPLCTRLFGRDGEAADWNNIWHHWLHHEDRSRVQAEVDSALSGAGQPFDTTYRATLPDGSTRWLRSQGRLVDNAGGEKRFHGATVDITDLKRGEEQSRKSNHDLERFAYVASHDLQEPLRNVISFSELFARRNKTIDPESRQYLEFVKQGGSRMQSLLNDLLTFSRVTQAASEHLELLDSKEVLAEVVAEMEAALRSNSATVEMGDLPKLQANFGQLSQVFQNLLSNALKFKGAAPPSVHIDAQRLGRAWLFSVADNGMGFDMAYSERIFEAFRRLHPRDQYPGTGLGLAICQRIVERHGGRIWAESIQGSGSTFFFTIGDAAAAAATA